MYEGKKRLVRPVWSTEVQNSVKTFVVEHPCFYLEEVQSFIQETHPELPNTSIPTICRALRHVLKLSRKRIEKRAREAVPRELEDFKFGLRPFYNFPEQLVFVDETSKDGRDAIRRYGWAPVGAPAVVSLPFARGKRVSALAAFNSHGFFAWSFTPDTFTRIAFHNAFVDTVLPHLNPYPMPNSIVIIDNARIHMYKEFQDAIESRGALLFFLPPYSPHLNPIETGFSLVKRYIQKNGFLAFHHLPEPVLDLAFRQCSSKEELAINLFAHSGYGRHFLQFK